MIYTLRFGAAAWVFVCAGSAFAAAGADLAPIQTGLDYHSFANVEQFRVTHVELNLRVDFVNKVLFGEAALEIKRLDPRATELVLDTRDLDIRDVSEKPTNVLGALSKSETTWVSRPFHLDKSDPILGSPLVIELPPLKKSTEIIKTSPRPARRRCSGSPISRPPAGIMRSCTRCLRPSAHAAGFPCRTPRR